MFHTEAIGGNSEEIARTSGSCHGDLTHGRGALALAYAKMMQIAIYTDLQVGCHEFFSHMRNRLIQKSTV